MDRAWQHQMQQCTRIVRDKEDEYIRRHCHRKYRHLTEESARNEAIRLTMKYFNDDTPLQEYYCEICDGYHVGNAKNERIY